MLFQSDMGKHPFDHVRRTFWQHRDPVEDEARDFADDLFRVAGERQPEIDQLIQQHAQHWKLDRMAPVDRNVLRCGVAELLGFPQTPHAVVINEALEIARKFGAPESVQFVNGVLDGIARDLPNHKKEAQQ